MLATLSADAVFEVAIRHSLTCTRCSMPIVDEEGNPGYFGEACPAGRDILAAYLRSIGEDVPSCYASESEG